MKDERGCNERKLLPESEAKSQRKLAFIAGFHCKAFIADFHCTITLHFLQNRYGR